MAFQFPPPKRVSSSAGAGIHEQLQTKGRGQHMANTSTTANMANMAKSGCAAATAMHHARSQPPTPRTRPCIKRTRR
eukprot:5907726-Prymnesium_polylepis.1